MIRKLFRLINVSTTFFVYFCAATLFSQTILFGYFATTWKLDREKLVKILAIAQDVDLDADRGDALDLPDETPPEETSYEAMLERRKTLFRDFELREIALGNATDALMLEQQLAADDLNRIQSLIDRFEADVLALSEGAQAQGREENIRILENLKPDQAKMLLVEMLDNNEQQDVVLLIQGMQELKRSKIIGEFETDIENQEIAELLRMIRRGEPINGLADQALGLLQPNESKGL